MAEDTNEHLGSSDCSVVLCITFANDKLADNWEKTVRMQRVPVKGEVVWVSKMEDFVVTDVWWCAETGRAFVRCLVRSKADSESIAFLRESGFVQV